MEFKILYYLLKVDLHVSDHLKLNDCARVFEFSWRMTAKSPPMDLSLLPIFIVYNSL